MQPIGKLHKHHADVAGHRQKHLAQIFGLRFGAIGEVKTTKLGDALHKFADLRSEMTLQLLWSDVGVLHHIVQEACRDHAGAGTDVPEQIGHCHRMNDVRVSAGSELTLMQLKREIKCSSEQGL